MPADFLNDLSLSDEERAKLAAFGAKTPFALLSIRKASRAAFDRHLGEDRAGIIAQELESRLSEQERETLRQPPRAPGRLGARLEPPPAPKPWR